MCNLLYICTRESPRSKQVHLGCDDCHEQCPSVRTNGSATPPLAKKQQEYLAIFCHMGSRPLVDDPSYSTDDYTLLVCTKNTYSVEDLYVRIVHTEYSVLLSGWMFLLRTSGEVLGSGALRSTIMSPLH